MKTNYISFLKITLVYWNSPVSLHIYLFMCVCVTFLLCPSFRHHHSTAVTSRAASASEFVHGQHVELEIIIRIK